MGEAGGAAGCLRLGVAIARGVALLGIVELRSEIKSKPQSPSGSERRIHSCS